MKKNTNTNTKVLLWLDDMRNPSHPYWLEVYPKQLSNNNVVWVKNYSAFVEWIEQNGLPYMIAFDHDLGESDDKSGMDCAKWLVEYCLDNGKLLPEYIIQSANPVGVENIDGLFKSFRNFRNKN